jgi:hypothetical protein
MASPRDECRSISAVERGALTRKAGTASVSGTRSDDNFPLAAARPGPNSNRDVALLAFPVTGQARRWHGPHAFPQYNDCGEFERAFAWVHRPAFLSANTVRRQERLQNSCYRPFLCAAAPPASIVSALLRHCYGHLRAYLREGCRHS